jgi:uncharacterized membrane protein YhaH (DUF805 family)
MESLLKSIEALLRQFAIVPAMLVFMAGLFLCIMTKNYRRLRRETWTPDLMDSEKPLDELRVEWTAMRTRTILTNRRVLQLRLSWFLSKRKQKAVALEDVHSVIWRRSANWLYLLAALWFVGTLNPLALLLVLLGLEAKMYSVRFDTPFAQMPWTRVAVLTFWRRQFAEFRRFYKAAQAAWARVRAEKGLPPVPLGQEPPAAEQDFRWGRAVWIYAGLFMACALAQRILEPHISFDDYFFGPLYLALPVAVAARSGRDALWAAILGSAALFTVKFPVGGILGAPLSDGRAPYFEQYLLIAITSLLMVGLARLIATRLSQSLAFLALCLWPVFVGVHVRDGFADLALYAKVGVAAAIVIVLMWAERALSDFYLRPERVAAAPTGAFGTAASS